MATLAKGNCFLMTEQFLFKAAYYLRLILTVLAHVFAGCASPATVAQHAGVGTLGTLSLAASPACVAAACTRGLSGSPLVCRAHCASVF